MALINCSECGAQVSDKATNCIKCGAPIVKKEVFPCFECGIELEKGVKTCSNCGAEQEQKTEPIKEQIKEVVQEKKAEPKTEEATKITQSQSNPTQTLEKKKKSPFRVILIVLLVLAVAIIGLMVVNNPNAMPGVKLEINTPKPLVITSRSDGGKSGLFNARATVYATIKNEGGAGNVLVSFNVTQGGNGSWDKSKSIYLAAGEVGDVEMTFEEVNYIDGDITYNVTADAQ